MRPPRIPAPRWLPGGHAQTIWPKLFARLHHEVPPSLRRERWDTPDGDFVDCDWLQTPVAGPRPLLVLFHGLEGSSASHYSQAFASHAQQLGWGFAIPHFRGCSGELNLAPRAYHSGDHEEIAWMLAQLQARHDGPLLAVGVSLGGNALLRWAQEAGGSARRRVKAIAAISAPLDLAAAGTAIHQGLNRVIYTRYFLRSMVPKALRKLQQHPGLKVDAERLRAARSLIEFDDCFTAPVHGFADAQDYYQRSSAGSRLHQLRLPSLVLNARNDPFVPATSLPRPFNLGKAPVTLWQPDHGGHVGFPSGRWPGSALGLPASVCAWLGGTWSMDEIVKAALLKWPNVPDCRGWLALDARGDWYMRDEACQRAGPFPNPKGSVIRHDKLRDFIQRNYEADASGAWYFQNGPQRVYVELEAAPLVLRVLDAASVDAHTGERLAVLSTWLDERGWLYALTPRGLGLVHSQDMDAAADLVEAGAWQPEVIERAQLPARFGFVLRP